VIRTWRTWLGVLGIGLLLLPVAATAAVLRSYDPVFHPRLDAPGHPDAVVVLGPATVDGALQRGLQLAAADPGALLAVSIDPDPEGCHLMRVESTGVVGSELESRL